MLRWRRLRWALFLVSILADGVIFYYSDPFTPRSFLASGLAAVIIFFVFFEVAFLFNAMGRIKGALVGREEITYQVGRHLFALIRNICADKLARGAVIIPLWLAFFGTIALGAIAWFGLVARTLPAGWTDWLQYACGAYIPLLLAMPFVVEHTSEWRSNQYVVVIDRALKKPSLLIHYGVFSYNLETVSLDRTVTTQLRQSFWDSFFAYGDLELRETAGGADARKLEAVWRPRKLEREIRQAIHTSRSGDGGSD